MASINPPRKRDGFASYARFSIIISLHIPAIGWHFNDAFPAFDKKLPKGILRTHAAGETAADSNNRNTLFLHGGGLLRRGGLTSAAYDDVKSATNPVADL